MFSTHFVSPIQYHALLPKLHVSASPRLAPFFILLQHEKSCASVEVPFTVRVIILGIKTILYCKSMLVITQTSNQFHSSSDQPEISS